MLALAVLLAATAGIGYFGWRYWKNSEPRRGGAARAPRRLALIEATIIADRRLLLVRRDGVEHLILTGGPIDLIVESGIEAPRRMRAEPELGGPAMPRREPPPVQLAPDGTARFPAAQRPDAMQRAPEPGILGEEFFADLDKPMTPRR